MFIIVSFLLNPHLQKFLDFWWIQLYINKFLFKRLKIFIKKIIKKTKFYYEWNYFKSEFWYSGMRVDLISLPVAAYATSMYLSLRREGPLSFSRSWFTFLFSFSLSTKALFFAFLIFFCLLLGFSSQVWGSILGSEGGRGTYSSPFSLRRSICAFIISSLMCLSLNASNLSVSKLISPSSFVGLFSILVVILKCNRW